ncbi:hypothetical protein ABI_03840 [Asticcacaulis biprosthecium C19]|uniref:Uncharacterized protein n=1 Tax=Asticcacaulis biprosthecium C19 TaxID=715226 RepID=F4QJK1_9CAUL|nr:hypothetical protein [Asticcacaulis biprosthecium]EGF91952.1 hypothetical protein ABI_03840 [Asticcacaulis biprosthecium C19]
MTEPTPNTPNEDRRRPKAMIPYLALWASSILCVIFALFAMLNQG